MFHCLAERSEIARYGDIAGANEMLSKCGGTRIEAVHLKDRSLDDHDGWDASLSLQASEVTGERCGRDRVVESSDGSSFVNDPPTVEPFSHNVAAGSFSLVNLLRGRVDCLETCQLAASRNAPARAAVRRFQKHRTPHFL